MQTAVDKRGDPVEILWIAAAVVFASVATGCAALFASLAGSLSPAVGLASLVAGGVAGVLVVRSVRGAGLGAGEPARGGGPWGALALVAFAAASIRQFGWIAYEQGGILFTLLPNNYGDLPLHWTYVQHLAGGAPFWPENPILTHDRLRYPFGVDLLTAVFVQLGASLPTLLPVMGLAGAALAAFALRAWGGGFAVAAFLFSGGLAGFQVLTGDLADHQNAVAWKNLFLALFVPQRGFLLALPAGLLLLWSWRRRLLRGEPALAPWIEGIVWGVMPLVHLHTFTFVSVVYAAWALGNRRLRPAVPTLAWAFLPATWAVWQVTEGFRAASLVGWRPGWMIGGEGPLVFLLLNFGSLPPRDARGAVGRGAGATPRGALPPRPRARRLRGALRREARPVGVGQHEGHAVVLRGGPAPGLGPRARAGAPVAARAPARGPLLLRGGVRARGVDRPRAVAPGARPPRVRGGVRGAARRGDDARGDRLHVQPPGGAVREADRGGLPGAPVEPRPRLRGGREGARAPPAGRGGLARGCEGPRGEPPVLGAPRGRRVPDVVASRGWRPDRPSRRGTGALSTGSTDRRGRGSRPGPR